ncbi:DUF7169 domain-containing protein [Streptomyces nitrosporeus]|uniref:DUF7169 domain-containing protein n=1 Tax=Streptomyces nitrosporeus TaxID=28894 RepID=UPI0019C32D17|nr:hypothetical protein GCM10010327_19640 [Streptomyces nitrosporeus]
MTYSPFHVAEGQHLITLLDTLRRDLDELRHMVTVYDDAMTMPGRTPDVDPDGTGRRMTADPSRPTEIIALDGARAALKSELKNGATYVAHAIAYVRGTTASMDRALLRWEGVEGAGLITGGCHARTDGTALHSEAGRDHGGSLNGTGDPAPAPLGG